MTEPADDGVRVLVVVLVLEAELVADVVAVDALVTVLAVVVAPVLLVLIERVSMAWVSIPMSMYTWCGGWLPN